MSVVYLDHNATTPIHEDVWAAMQAALPNAWANPSSLHQAGRNARRVVDDAREAVAQLTGLHPRDVVFTSGGTEANNLAIWRPFLAPTKKDGVLVTSRLEHPSVIACAEALEQRGHHVVWLAIERDVRFQPAKLADQLQSLKDKDFRLLVVHAVHHETGAIQDIGALVAVAEQFQTQVHVDAVQAAGRVPTTCWHGAHSVALASHKLRGPKGIGAIVTRPEILLRPLLLGGSQERGFRPGTQDAVAAAGFRIAALRAYQDGPARYAELQPLRDHLEQALIQAGKDVGIDIQSTLTHNRAPHVSHLTMAGIPGDEIVAALDLEGVCVSAGSACSAGTAEPSPAIAALVGPELAKCSLRISLGETSTWQDVETTLQVVKRVLPRLKPLDRRSRLPSASGDFNSQNSR
jgi:cysteine desulfurase